MKIENDVQQVKLTHSAKLYRFQLLIFPLAEYVGLISLGDKAFKCVPNWTT
jgi:hypothetical protein